MSHDNGENVSEAARLDEWGRRLSATRCAACRRELELANSFLEALTKRGRAVLCQPCEFPGRYEWKKVSDEHGPREVIVPLSSTRRGQVIARRKKLLPGDAEALRLHQVRLDLTAYRWRVFQLEEGLAKFTQLLAETRTRVAELEAELPGLEARVQAAFADPFRQQRARIAELQARIAALRADLAEPAGGSAK